ncbi:ABC transporter permease [Telmatospirillum sp.]|uniref:ABC transporter permease n=1 Tax=Telmatospirillum sp. TaxID=2079197 RepID=UPI00283F4031|nr:ABC transporter permease [Telmatospirillum sp.]MDR3435571.1 ABC transporter permease [Telmatospirillum sp.]
MVPSATSHSTPLTSRPRMGQLTRYFGLLGVLVAMCALFGVLSEHFLTMASFSTIANQIPALAVMAVGMTFVLIIGGIDLSVGSVLAFSGAVMSVAIVQWELGLFPGIILALATGILCGAFTGAISVSFKIPSFIVSLGMLEMARGGAYSATGSRTEYIGGNISMINDPLIGKISPAFLLAVAIVVLGHILLNRTVFGRHLIGIGTNEEAMRLAGINTHPPKIVVFMLMGLLSAIGALFQVARMEAADPNAGAGMELSVIAAVVIGGTSLMGGRGSVLASFFGVLIIAVLESGLAQIGASEPTKRIITGIVIITAVVLDMYRSRRANRE